MNKHEARRLFPGLVIYRTNLNLVAFCKTVIGISGYISVIVRAKQIECELNIYITDVQRKPLLGREWIRQLAISRGMPDFLDCNVVESSHRIPTLENILGKYKDLRSDVWSKITEVKAKLTLIPKAIPVFLKARPVPFNFIN